MPTYSFKQVDVFTSRPFFGNPVAVVLSADGIETSEMQRIATWTNLSETTFVLRPTTPEADYRLRIFTPRLELPFAGHPTIGSAHAILESGLLSPSSGMMKQECGMGILQLRVENSGVRKIFVQAPASKFTPLDLSYYDRLSIALNSRFEKSSEPLLVNVGPVWLIVNVGSAEAVAAIRPNQAEIAKMSEDLNLTGITVFGISQQSDRGIHVRSFAPAHGVPEDPVCGSGNVSVASFLAKHNLTRQTGEDYVAHQGMALGRQGQVHVRVRGNGEMIEIGGNSVTCIDGTISI